VAATVRALHRIRTPFYPALPVDVALVRETTADPRTVVHPHILVCAEKRRDGMPPEQPAIVVAELEDASWAPVNS
jgi:hypothetical protein